ncbi:hypothetical protein MseVgp160 [Melanoplus sanguinipes entomopoxvirus]|uniref:Uncharacterized protein n=1 Tax=Melanoplus sanguinipes entomopoxvirus TaxID=83191 RepID=Q9YVT2_MSEPV|nr:hypothetical protein MseVgp160 [Melanoplus sanguinipes entomopoxvirus]AAC97779.1 ORF MSV160 hypothetical protein [Melanoplus sanguinipes entomopoxvirus 'O']
MDISNIVLDHFSEINISYFNKIFEEIDYDISDYSFDSNDIGSLIIYTSDKKKMQVEKINIPSQYLDENKKKILKLLDNDKIKSLSENEKMRIFINIQLQLSNFNYENHESNDNNLLIDCFPYECKNCNNKVTIDNEFNIICDKNKNHKYTIDEYNKE